jgi:predicted dehydrogenase
MIVLDIVRMGVVGAGTIALRGIFPHLSQQDVQDRVRLQAVCDPFPGRAEVAASRFGIPRAFTDYRELLEHGDVDAVTIASPIALHYEQGKEALAAGKHVHFNKTMTTTTAEDTVLIEIAKANGLKMVAFPGEVLRPQNQQIRKLIAEGAIGRLCWAVCGAAFERYHENEEFRQGNDVLSNVDPSWYFRKPGGGPLYDMTVYGLHALTTVLGPAKRVTALSGTRIKEREFCGVMVPTDADDNTLILLDFGDSLHALAYGTAAGKVTEGPGGSYFGTEGSITGYKLNGKPLDYPGGEIAAETPGWTGEQWVLPHVTGPHREIEEQHVFEDIMQLVDWVRENKPSLVTAEHARHVSTYTKVLVKFSGLRTTTSEGKESSFHNFFCIGT